MNAHGIIALLRKTPTQTATRNSESLPVQELVSLGLLMTLSELRTGTFPTTSLGACSLCARCEADLYSWEQSSVPGGMHAA